MENLFRKTMVLGAAAFCLDSGVQPVVAQERGTHEDGARAVLEEIIVSARRREERLQDVPVSMTVLSQAAISQQNIVGAADLANYVPSLTVNDRFGSDNASFAIRGFTQDLRTTASVGVFFAEVVAQRAGVNGVIAGDGAGPGDLFDLENVQVLKGPQGTLFGRNTTGGAVMLQPKRPSDEFEGYVEASVGDYDLQRLQAVINIPIGDRLFLRAGIDDNSRDGYLRNQSGIGPKDHGSVNYTAGRISLLAEITDSLENYTVASFSDSDSRPAFSQLFACQPEAPTSNPLSSFCRAQLDRADGDFFDVEQQITNPSAEINSWRVINHTTWEINDNLALKNILSYGKLETSLVSAVLGTNFETAGGVPFMLVNSRKPGGLPSTDQKNFTEEIQLSGTAFDDRLTWQGGLYYEKSSANGAAGQISNGRLFCPEGAFPTLDPSTWRCQSPFGPVTGAQLQVGELELESRGVFVQGSYDLSSAFTLTAGLRHTWDVTKSDFQNRIYSGFSSTELSAPTQVVCGYNNVTVPDCRTRLTKKSDAPTWVVGLEYQGIDNTMLYGKYSRGYRQGSINAFGAQGFESYDPEKIDAYELGAKITLDGAVPGYINVAAFYNELTDQQLQTGLACVATPTFSCPVPGGTAILNAGESVSWGFEVDSLLRLTDRLTLNLAYTYLESEVKELAAFQFPEGSLFNTTIPLAAEGDPLPFSPKNQLVVSTNYLLPTPADLGDISLGATYVFNDKQLTSSRSPYGMPDSYELLNLNLDWQGIAGTGVDISFFVTNALNEKYTTNVAGNWLSFGAEFRNIGQPRMFGGRLRYNF